MQAELEKLEPAVAAFEQNPTEAEYERLSNAIADLLIGTEHDHNTEAYADWLEERIENAFGLMKTWQLFEECQRQPVPKPMACKSLRSTLRDAPRTLRLLRRQQEAAAGSESYQRCQALTAAAAQLTAEAKAGLREKPFTWRAKKVLAECEEFLDDPDEDDVTERFTSAVNDLLVFIERLFATEPAMPQPQAFELPPLARPPPSSQLAAVGLPEVSTGANQETTALAVLLHLLRQYPYPHACYAGKIIYEHRELKAWAIETEPAQECFGARFIFWQLELYGKGPHANMLLYDAKLGQAEVFEPHGGLKASYHLGEQYDKLERKLRKVLAHPELELIRPGQFCPVGPQSYDVTEPGENVWDDAVVAIGGYCAVWSFLYLQQRLENPDVPRESIAAALAEASKRDQSLVKENQITYQSTRIYTYALQLIALRQQALDSIDPSDCVAAFDELMSQLQQWLSTYNQVVTAPSKFDRFARDFAEALLVLRDVPTLLRLWDIFQSTATKVQEQLERGILTDEVQSTQALLQLHTLTRPAFRCLEKSTISQLEAELDSLGPT